jgi:ABC-2 type transport system ATP-binding protein
MTIGDTVPEAPEGPPALKVIGLFHRFGELVAIDGLTVEVGPGEIVGLVGRNGAGKTTAMRAVMGIIRPERGDIRWSGHPVGPADRLRFGYMPEERGLYPQMRILDQVAYFGQLHGLASTTAKGEAQSWLLRLGLAGRELDRVVALSHGNQQRVQLAVALVHHPDLLVLDEPFAGLDPTAVDALSDILRSEAQRHAAVLFSSHQLEIVERLCSRIVILEEGRALAAGTLAELRARCPQQLRVKVDGSTEWAAQLPGVRVVRQDANGVVLLLGPGTDPQVILMAAQASGPVEQFGFEACGLIDVYRQLVSP